MSRRNNKITTQAEAADLVSALSEASGSSSSSSAPIHATRGASAALLAKEINKDAQPVATSSLGLGFRSFSPLASQSIPPASSNLFLSEDDLPPSNQLQVPQIMIPDTMLPGSLSAKQLLEVMLPLSTMKVNTSYSLLRTLRTFCCKNPGVLDTTVALVELPPDSDARSPYQVPPPAPAWPVPQLPLKALSLDGDLRQSMHRMCMSTTWSKQLMRWRMHRARTLVVHETQFRIYP